MYFPVDSLRAIRQYFEECIKTKPNFWRYFLKGELPQKIEQVQSLGLEEITCASQTNLSEKAALYLITPDADDISRMISRRR